MKTIGLLGGMSWGSTVNYYRGLNEGMKARLGGLHSAKLLLWSVDFDEIELLQRAGQWARSGEILAEAARSLEVAGAELLLLCTNTMHKVSPAIEAAIGIPFLHIADATAEEARRRGLRTLGLLGTRFTMEEPFYRERLEAAGLTVLLPGEADRERVHRVIFDELCLSVFREDSREDYRAVLRRLVEQGAEGIILGCTEIGMLVQPADASVPLLDTTEIHVASALDAALGGDAPG